MKTRRAMKLRKRSSNAPSIEKPARIDGRRRGFIAARRRPAFAVGATETLPAGS
jgi:hypothetical protein